MTRLGGPLPYTFPNKTSFEAGRRAERCRPRKSGYAVDARPYRHHIAVRMTYAEAKAFSTIMLLFDPKMLDAYRDTNPGIGGAYSRLMRKAQACDLARRNRS
jgi:hypothetical protein